MEDRGQISSFVKSMKECVDDFIAKGEGCESDEELYEDLDVEAPYPPDYGSEEYDYPTKAKAKVACKEAVQFAINDMLDIYETEKDNIVSYAERYLGGLEEMFRKFINELLESYDEYAFLECEGQTQEYILTNKSKILDNENFGKELEQVNLKAESERAVNLIFDTPVKELLNVKECFSLCSYGDEEAYYCFNMDDACEKIYDDMYNFLKAAQTNFPGNVKKAYVDSIITFCKKLKDRLVKL